MASTTQSVADEGVAVGMKLTLDQLLSDVLLSVWVHLDDPVPLSRANKRFHALSKDVLWRAKWFMQRYDIYLVLFEAMTRIRGLFSWYTCSGTQRHARRYAGTNTLDGALVCGHEYTRWGTISPQSYAAVMTYASDNRISYDVVDTDGKIFSTWLWRKMDSRDSGWPDPGAHWRVRQMFQEGFVPLQLVIDTGGGEGLKLQSTNSADEIGEAIVFDPALTAAAIENGYILTADRIGEILQRLCYHYKPRETRESLKALMVDGVLNISRSYAKDVFVVKSGLRAQRGPSIRTTCDILEELNEQSALPFDLQEVIDEVAASE